MSKKKERKSAKGGSPDRLTFKEAAEIMSLIDSTPGQNFKLELPDLKLSLSKKQST